MTIEKLKTLEPIFGSWYVDSKLAEGRHSKVFKVYKTHEGVTKFLALKTVKFPSSDRELSKVIESGKYKTVNEYLDMLEGAVTENMNKMLSLRTNPNIVRYDNFSIVRENSCFYVIMLMELLTPFSDCVRSDSISSEQAAKIGKDLSLAVDGFRNAGIIHHQIKPENIYVDSQGNYKLGDFGISNIADRIKTEASPYMAPELYNKSPYDTSSDIYSVGVLLYKLLNNNRLPFLPPFPAPVSLADREKAFEKQMRGDIPPAPAKADEDMAKIISKAISHKQSDRYYSPMLIYTELERYEEYLAYCKAQNIIPPLAVSAYAPVNNYGFTGNSDEGVSLASDYENVTKQPKITVAEAEKAVFRQTYKEEADDEDEETANDDNSDDKKVYLLIAAIIAVLGVIIALLFFIFISRNSEEETTRPETTVSRVTQTTTAPTTAFVETTAEETTAEETTAEETTEEETTAEETTAEETTTEETTAPTTAATTAEATTQGFTGTPELVASGYDDGDTSSDGRTYREISDYTIVQSPENEFFDEVILDIGTLMGDNIRTSGSVYIYEMSGSAVIQKVSAQMSFLETVEDGEPLITCFINIDDGDFYYSPEYYEYYVCLEEGAIESDSYISLPLQIEV